jgi:hypothetical protein
MNERRTPYADIKKRFKRAVSFGRDIPMAERSPEQRRLYELYYQSFRLSQGDTSMQEAIFQWYTQKGHLEGLHIPVLPPKYLKDITPPKQHQSIHSREAKVESIKVYHMLYALSRTNNPPMSMGDPVDYITNRLVMKDELYQRKIRPNRREQENVTPDSKNDKYASFIRKFVLGRQSVGTDVVNQLLQEVRTKILDCLVINKQEPHRRIVGLHEDLVILQKEWEENHPGESFIQPEVMAEIDALIAAREAEFPEFSETPEPSVAPEKSVTIKDREQQIFRAKQSRKKIK